MYLYLTNNNNKKKHLFIFTLCLEVGVSTQPATMEQSVFNSCITLLVIALSEKSQFL